MMDVRGIQGTVDTVAGVDAGVKVLSVVQAPDGTLSRVSFGCGQHRALVRLNRVGAWLATAQTPHGIQTLETLRESVEDAVIVAARHLADAAPHARPPQRVSPASDGTVMADGRAVGRALPKAYVGDEPPCEVQSFVDGEFTMPSADEVRRIAHGVAASMEKPPRPNGVSTADVIAAVRSITQRPLTAKEAWDMVAAMDHEADEARQRVWAALGLDDEAPVDEMVDAVERLRAVADGAAVRPTVRRAQRSPVYFKMPGDMGHTDRRTFADGDDPTRHLDWSDDDG